jgi:hypothetical protein
MKLAKGKGKTRCSKSAERNGFRRLALEKRIQSQLRAGKGMLAIARECKVGTGTVQRVAPEIRRPFDGANVVA